MEFRASPWHVGGEFSSPAQISQLELSVEPTYVYAGLFLTSPELWDACVRASPHRDSLALLAWWPLTEQGPRGLMCLQGSRSMGLSPLSFCLSIFTSLLLSSSLSFKNSYDGERVERNRTICSVLLLEVHKTVAADTPAFGQRRILSFRS